MGRWSNQPRVTRGVIRVVRPLLRLFTKQDWRGAASLPSGGYILAPNHLSHLDPLVLSHFLVDQGIVPRFLAKDTLLQVKVFGPLIRGTEQIPVYRATGGAADALRGAKAAIEAGQVVSVYPEGTITRDPDAWPMSGRTGAVRLALITGAPLIPVAQWGAQELLWPYTKRLRLFPRKTMRIQIGSPMDLSGLDPETVTEAELHDMTDKLMDTITGMVADIRGTRPTTPRIDVHTLAKPKTTYQEPES